MTDSKRRWRRILVYIVYFAFLIGLQAAWPASWSRTAAKPNFILILAVLCAYLYSFSDALLCALIAGYFLDYLFGKTVGPGMLIMLGIALLSHYGLRKKLHANIIGALLICLLMSALFQLASTALSYLPLLNNDISSLWPGLGTYIRQTLWPAVRVNILPSILLFVLLYFAGPYRRHSYDYVKLER
ncbi:MAG: rod shape-determining protein MreD [Oscillospiraceae bacterium]|nr:rod shape-determining protein MreD [Oscillospiraceae bacterium]MDD4368583.1 rod shape-determining protein MreD [Oscillospiraceae bacterium]